MEICWREDGDGSEGFISKVIFFHGDVLTLQSSVETFVLDMIRHGN